jgi:signal transduction histidine kinase
VSASARRLRLGLWLVYAWGLMRGRQGSRYGPFVRWRLVAVDVFVAVAAWGLSAAVLAGAEPVADDLREPDVAAYVLVAIYSALPIIRRWAPVVAVFGGLATGVAYAAAQYPVALTPVVLLSIYTAAAVLAPRRARLLLAGAVVLGIVGATASPGPTDVGVPALIVSAWLLGSYVGSRRTYTAELEDKNRLLEQARVELAERAVAEERLRIARELHDVVAHTMSVVAVHAGTGRMVADEDPAAARQALGTIETTTRSALMEMRRMLGVLRGSDSEGPGTLVPAPGLGDLDALVADVVRSGVIVEVRVEGERTNVPAGVDLAAYRIVQEALTNVIKHAGRVRVTVTVRYSDDAVTVEVDDEGATGHDLRSVPAGTGHGLVGMRERVAMYDGDLDVGPGPIGGFHVAARLPFRAPT